MSKKYIQRGLVLALTLLVALAAFAVPAFADDEAPTETSTAKTFTWTDNEPLVLNIRADEGFRMPEFFVLRINDAEYTVFTTGAENPEGITYDSSTGKLSVSPALIHDGDSFALVGSAVGVHVDAEGLTDIAVSADLGRDFSAAKPLELTLVPAEGYVLPAELHLVINDILYTVYTDGTVYNDGVVFDPARGVLTVDASYLKIGQTLTLSGAAVCVDPDKEAEQEQEQETDTNLYIAVDVTALENITFTESASNTEMKRGEGNVVTLAPGQDLALSVAPAPGTVLPEALSVTIRRVDGFVIEETFRFDGKDNAQFLAFDPATQQMRIAANIILNLDAIVIAPVPAAEPTPEPTAAPAAEPSAAPAVEPTAAPPSAEPSVEPSAAPSTAPSVEPTSAPTASPSVSPAVSPSPSPAASPAASPVVSPTVRPSTSPVE